MASSAPTREIDFFAMEERQRQQDAFPSPRGVSVRDIHRAAARMDPGLLRSLINSRPPPRSDLPSSSCRPVRESPTGRGGRGGGGEEGGSAMAPLTIFYNGSVRVYDVPNSMAEVIIKLAAEEVRTPPEPAVASSSPVGGAAHQGYQQRQEKMLLDGMHAEGDLPLYRKRSLQRFLEKRRERLAMTCFSKYPPRASSSSTSGNYIDPRRWR